MNSPVSFNLFQRLLRQWERVHPYNAAQAMQLRGPMDLARASEAWHATLAATGLGRARTGRITFTFETPGDGWRDRFIDGPAPGTPLNEFLARELNRRFDDPQEPPFRPFLLQGDGSYHLGIIYEHWIADSVSIRMLMREWFLRLHDPAAARHRPFRQPQQGYWHLFGPNHSNWQWIEGVLQALRLYLQYRKTLKIDSAQLDQPRVGVSLAEAPVGLIDRVSRYARANGVKVNDLFVAAMVDLSRKYVPTQKRANRKNIAVGSIVDLRPFATLDLADVFGIFLGFSSVVCTPNEMSDWPRLLKTVATQNRLHRATGMTQASMIWMAAAALAGNYAGPGRLYHFYRKEMPLAGGISNVTLNRDWPARFHPDPLMTYLRVSPTGPMAPIVFTATTLGSTLRLGVTYREALISSARAQCMMGAFFDRLQQLT